MYYRRCINEKYENELVVTGKHIIQNRSRKITITGRFRLLVLQGKRQGLVFVSLQRQSIL